MSKKQRDESNESKRKMQIGHFLDIDTNKITFEKPKSNKYNGSQIGILYNGETMYVKYEGITPFGLKENYDKDNNNQGKSMQLNCKDKYLEKAKELDEFFINSFYENKWGLSKNIPKSNIEGYDDHGQGGLWKRICKYPYKVNKTLKRENISIIHQIWNLHYFTRMTGYKQLFILGMVRNYLMILK